jgi:hypothetical protein
MHSGCPERNAYATPDIALDRIISVAPSWSFVYSAKSAPNAMAGARHAKKRKATDDRHRPAVGGEEGVGPVADVMGRAAFDVRHEATRELTGEREGSARVSRTGGVGR